MFLPESPESTTDLVETGLYISTGNRAKNLYSPSGDSEMARQKIKVFDSRGIEIKDEWLRKRTLAANRIIRRQRKPEIEANIRGNRKAFVEEAKNKPYVKALKWNLGAHLKEDICDKLTTQDLYGLGPGCYPVNAYPEIPHDNCHCWDSYIFDDDCFRNYQPSKEEIEALKRDPHYPELKKWVDGFLSKVESSASREDKKASWGNFIRKLFKS